MRQNCLVCRAMVFGWSRLSDGDPNYSLTQVATSFERLHGRIRLCRTEALGCLLKTQHASGSQAAEALRHNGSCASMTNATAS